MQASAAFLVFAVENQHLDLLQQVGARISSAICRNNSGRFGGGAVPSPFARVEL